MLRIFVMLIIVRQGPLDNRSNVIIGISHLLIHYITLNFVFFNFEVDYSLSYVIEYKYFLSIFIGCFLIPPTISNWSVFF